MKNLGEIICIAIVTLTFLKNFLYAFKRDNIKNSLDSILSNISLIITLVLLLNFFTDVNKIIGGIINENFHYTGNLSFILRIICIAIVFVAVNSIIYYIFKILNKILFKDISEAMDNKKLVRVVLSGILGLIKGVLIVIILFMAVTFFNKSGVYKKGINIFNNISAYQKVGKIIDQKKVNNIRSGLVLDASKEAIIYYNGVTLKQGVKSDAAINEKAKELTKNANTNLEKAKILYTWIGSNITYNNEKAKEVMSGDRDLKSGAIVAYNTRQGICFDYACLYVAMARAVGLPVRLITGKAYNGEEYISHAWNQVYIKSLDKWINVDSTFYIAGDYFNTKDFDADHKDGVIAGQWE